MRALLIIAVLLIVGGTYYQFFYPPSAMQRKTDAALQEFSAAVATKDRAKITASLQKFLSDKTPIHLEVGFFSLSNPDNKPAAQDFDKQNFIPFVDNTLYSLTDYGYRVQLRDFTLSADHKTANITFTSQEWGDGMSYYAGTGLNMRFASSTNCSGEVIFGESLQLDKLACSMQLRPTPKPGEEHKLQSPEAIKEFLR